jgi:hypothetical protein
MKCSGCEFHSNGFVDVWLLALEDDGAEGERCLEGHLNGEKHCGRQASPRLAFKNDVSFFRGRQSLSL